MPDAGQRCHIGGVGLSMDTLTQHPDFKPAGAARLQGAPPAHRAAQDRIGKPAERRIRRNAPDEEFGDLTRRVALIQCARA